MERTSFAWVEMAQSAGKDWQTMIAGERFPSGLFSRRELNAYWQEHLSGKVDHKFGLWNLLSLQWWAA